MEHKKTTIVRDETGRFIFRPGTTELTTMDTPAGPIQIQTGKAMWICSCGITNCPQMTDD